MTTTASGFRFSARRPARDLAWANFGRDGRRRGSCSAQATDEGERSEQVGEIFTSPCGKQKTLAAGTILSTLIDDWMAHLGRLRSGQGRALAGFA